MYRTEFGCVVDRALRRVLGYDSTQGMLTCLPLFFALGHRCHCLFPVTVSVGRMEAAIGALWRFVAEVDRENDRRIIRKPCYLWLNLRLYVVRSFVSQDCRPTRGSCAALDPARCWRTPTDAARRTAVAATVFRFQLLAPDGNPREAAKQIRDEWEVDRFATD